ncbi:hypothetical protein BDN70DRAFT_867845 [Pholiota conissans]|uniref:CENP-C homolog n=1 Tax=Pholiota conissans TaxID=109636 RepID=A0A9P5YNG8_9AGAR|nr:hypothetical protein BDN70DRAFT_867845 [Pholiota conissans]
MPTSARKSSVGGAARRGPQKAHIPYRGDNPEVGKKTGIAVQHVERKSDGFEPFEEVLQQADGRTPPRPKGRKKSLGRMDRYEDDYDDEDGEMSMQLDSPVHHLANMRPPTTPSTAGRRKSSIRPVARTNGVDYDEIPSPRPLQSTQRANRPGPSNLSHSVRAPDPEPSSDSPNEEAGENYDDYNMDNDGFDEYPPDDIMATPTSRGNQSFGQIEEEDEDEEEEEEQQEPESPQETRSKQKQQKPPAREPSQNSQEEEIEDEIAQGLEDVGLGPESSDEEQEETPRRPSKKAKVSPEKLERKPKTASRGKKENRPQREGIRRSQRERYAPLEYWRGEKLVYGRSGNSAPILVPQIKEIVRIPKEVPMPLGTKRKRSTTRARSRSRAVDAEEDVIPPALPVVNPEEGWDDKTEAYCTVISYTTKEEVHRRIAWTAKMATPKLAADRNWTFERIFGDDEFVAAGKLVIPPRSRKPSKAAKDNTYVFYVVEGAVNFKIHETSMIIASGGMFMVPRGNTYLIENISNRDAKLFFTQARKVEMNDEERTARAAHIAETLRRKSLNRSSSAAAPSTGVKTGPPVGAARAKSLVATITSSRYT